MNNHLRPAPFALTLIALFVGVTYWIPNHLYQRLPRLEDEVAGLWQARLYATGRIALPSPPAPEAFAVPYILDIGGQRFSKYQPGHAAILALGVLIGEPWIVNPLLFAVTFAVIYRFGKGLLGARLALLAVLLAVTSPMLLMLSASLTQHAASILTATLYLWGIFRLQHTPTLPHPCTPTLLSALTGLALGLTFLVRPFTALLLALPPMLLTLTQLRRHPREMLARHLPLAVAFALTSAILPAYNYLLVGKPAISLFTLWWAYDRPGFGPTVGPHGYYVPDVLKNVWLGLESLNYDLHGWLFVSLAPVALGLILKPRSRLEFHLGAYPIALFLGYLLLFHQSRLYGPRYYSEAIAPCLFLSARGVQKAFRAFGRKKEETSRKKTRVGFSSFILLPASFFLVLLLSNLLFYTPLRFNLLQHLYDGALNWSVVNAARSAGLRHAIVFMFADNWPGAAAGVMTNSLDLSDQVLFARYLGPDSFWAAQMAYPDRALYFWRDGALTPAAGPPPGWAPRCPTVCPPG